MKSLKGRNTVIKDSKRNLNTECDCEGDSTGAGLETSGAGVEKDETRAVLVTGSFSACVGFFTSFSGWQKLRSWNSLFFYRCTDVVLFAPLKSHGVDSRSQFIRDNTVEDAPPCSPKSMYILACLVRPVN